MDKDDVVHRYNGILTNHKKKNEMMSFATTWIDLGGIMFSEISQTEKEKNHMSSLICGSKTTTDQ